MGVIADILDAVIDSLETTPGIIQVQGASTAAGGTELKEAINTLPAIQVYFETFEMDATTPVQQSTFGGGIQQTDLVYHIDVYTAVRSNIGEDMRDTLPLVDAVHTLLRNTHTPPYFGSTDIKQFHYSAARVSFEYAAKAYLGVRFVLSIRHF